MDLLYTPTILNGYYNFIKILDDERVMAITPMFKHYKLQDVIPLLKQILLDIRFYEMICELCHSFNIKNYDITFSDKFVKLEHNDKQKIYLYIPSKIMTMLSDVLKNDMKYLKRKDALELLLIIKIDNYSISTTTKSKFFERKEIFEFFIQ